MSSNQFLRINDVVISVKHLLKLNLEAKSHRVLVYVSGKIDPFTFEESSPESATGLYADLCRLIQTTQQEVPFLFLSHMAIKLDSISSIHLNSAFPDIVISTANESGISRILFESKLEAQDEFNSLMSSMGMSKGDEASTTKGDSQ